MSELKFDSSVHHQIKTPPELALSIQQAVYLLQTEYANQDLIDFSNKNKATAIDGEGEIVYTGPTIENILTELEAHLENLVNPHDLDPKYQLLLKLNQEYQRALFIYDRLVNYIIVASIVIGISGALTFVLSQDVFNLHLDSETSSRSLYVTFVGIAGVLSSIALGISHEGKAHANFEAALLKVFNILESEERKVYDLSKKLTHLNIDKKLKAKRKAYSKLILKEFETDYNLKQQKNYQAKLERIGTQLVQDLAPLPEISEETIST